MNYQQTLDYLYSRLPMYTRIGKAAYKEDITNTLAMCKILENPQYGMICVHVAGTNGKGSVSHMLASIYQAAGYKTGLYTSPHLKDFRERIRIRGEMIPEEEIVNFVQRYHKVFEPIEPSFFEWTVALCLDYFVRQNTDVAIIETGLGGRLDSTNIVRPDLSIITNIGWDHTDLLGDTLAKIASEKAGIIKYEKPVVIGEVLPETKPVFEQKATEQKAPLFYAEEEVIIKKFIASSPYSIVDLEMKSGAVYNNIELDLGGIYQQKNLATVFCAVEQLRKKGYTILDEHIIEGLKHVKQNTGLMGRWQILSEKPLTICDTGHNINGITYVLEQIKQTPHKQLHLVFGMVNDKDISAVLKLLPKDAHYYFCNANIPRALPASELAKQAATFQLNGIILESVKDALAAAQKNASPDDLVFVGGSTFVVAEVV